MAATDGDAPSGFQAARQTPNLTALMAPEPWRQNHGAASFAP